jgi:hypothetical protein
MPPLLPEIETAVTLERDCPPYTSSYRYIKSKIIPLLQPKKRVRFARTDMVYPHIHFKDITNREKAHAWITPQEEISMRKHIDFTVMLMEEGEEIPQDDYCSRGLEYMIDSKEHQERIQRGREAVMGVQEFLRHSSSHDKVQEVDTKDVNMIAAIYSACTCQATDIAYNFGQSDFDDYSFTFKG